MLASPAASVSSDDKSEHEVHDDSEHVAMLLANFVREQGGVLEANRLCEFYAENKGAKASMGASAKAFCHAFPALLRFEVVVGRPGYVRLAPGARIIQPPTDPVESEHAAKCLSLFVQEGGGRIEAARLEEFCKRHPWARAALSVGARQFCETHAALLAFAGSPGSAGYVCLAPAEAERLRADSLATDAVARDLERFVADRGGAVAASELGTFYAKCSAAILALKCGVPEFCALHPALLRFAYGQNGGGEVRTVAAAACCTDARAPVVSDGGGRKADALCAAAMLGSAAEESIALRLLRFVQEFGGEVGGERLGEFYARCPEAKEFLKPSAKKFCQRHPELFEFVVVPANPGVVRLASSFAKQTAARPAPVNGQRSGSVPTVARPAPVNGQRSGTLATAARPAPVNGQRSSSVPRAARPAPVNGQRSGTLATAARPAPVNGQRSGTLPTAARPASVNGQRSGTLPTAARPAPVNGQRSGTLPMAARPAPVSGQSSGSSNGTASPGKTAVDQAAPRPSEGSVAELLADIIRTRGGEMEAAEVAKELARYPKALEVVDDGSGLAGFFARHVEVFRTEEVAGGETFVVRVMSDASSGPLDDLGHAAAGGAPTLLEPLAGLVDAGAVCIAREEGCVYASTSSWEVLRPLEVGETLIAAGPAELAEGRLLFPIEPRGAVQLDTVVIEDNLRTGAPAPAQAVAEVRAAPAPPPASSVATETQRPFAPAHAGGPPRSRQAAEEGGNIDDAWAAGVMFRLKRLAAREERVRRREDAVAAREAAVSERERLAAQHEAAT